MTHSAPMGWIMTKFDIIGACATLFLLCVFIYAAKIRTK
jgi:hypothetical protein